VAGRPHANLDEMFPGWQHSKLRKEASDANYLSRLYLCRLADAAQGFFWKVFEFFLQSMEDRDQAFFRSTFFPNYLIYSLNVNRHNVLQKHSTQKTQSLSKLIFQNKINVPCCE
jgi:hypothetical protein